MGMFDWLRRRPANVSTPASGPANPSFIRAAVASGSDDAENIAQYQFVETTLSEAQNVSTLLRREDILPEQVAVLEKLVALLENIRTHSGTAFSGFTSDDLKKLAALGTHERPLQEDTHPDVKGSGSTLLRHFYWQREAWLREKLADKEFALPNFDLRMIMGGCAVSKDCQRLGGGH